MFVGEKYFDILREIAPHLPDVTNRDMMSCITDRERFLDYFPGQKIVINARVGDLIPAGDPIHNVLQSGQKIVANVPKEVYGVPFKAIMIPIQNDVGKVIGCLGLGLSMENEAKVLDLATNLAESAGQIASAVQQIASSASEINVSERQLNEKILSISNAVKKISDITQFIKSIADQTKMLGLNAAIEAARAGDAGRGFGVVAEEIRKLSDDSKQTTEQIWKLTNEIDTYVADTVSSGEKTLRSSEEQAASTEEINASIEEMTSMAEHLEHLANLL
ncbi:MAG: methyl-accepting chemotaxis protein [Ignavibacteriales bacterium]